MGEAALNAEIRDGSGKGVARKLRAVGRIPVVLYGGKSDPQSLSIDSKEFLDLLHSSSGGINTLIDLNVSGGKGGTTVIVKDLQRDPVDGSPLHADLFAIDTKALINVSVPVRLIGIPAGVRISEGILDHMLHDLEVACLPGAIPEAIEVDVTDLDIGQIIHVSDLALPEGVTVVSDDQLGVASVHIPRIVEEEEPEAEAAEGEGEGEGEEAAESAEE